MDNEKDLVAVAALVGAVTAFPSLTSLAEFPILWFVTDNNTAAEPVSPLRPFWVVSLEVRIAVVFVAVVPLFQMGAAFAVKSSSSSSEESSNRRPLIVVEAVEDTLVQNDGTGNVAETLSFGPFGPAAAGGCLSAFVVRRCAVTPLCFFWLEGFECSSTISRKARSAFSISQSIKEGSGGECRCCCFRRRDGDGSSVLVRRRFFVLSFSSSSSVVMVV